ncbi:amine dehydrogenase large subunit [Salinisphaera sp. T31B1]|uniref:amine dehydrogenase large subunit n=1 Tax=Salinisphaera sp. T31B1 TaxID=727963 RepID=UPI00333FAF40
MTVSLFYRISRRAVAVGAICALSLAGAAHAAGNAAAPATGKAFEPETFTVKPSTDGGALVLVNQASWDGASRIHVYAQDGLTYQGLLSLGLTSQFIVSHDHSKVYGLSDYMKRYTYGPIDSVVQVFDLKTLEPIAEVSVPNKAVKSIGMEHLLEISADEKYLYVQNATPGTSVTVVDLEAMKVVGEIPTPGCYGIFPSVEGHRFTTLCGPGTLNAYDVDADEPMATPSEPFFDVEHDALYLHSVRTTDGHLVFTSFNGNLYVVDDSADKPTLVRKMAVTDGVEGHWAPGGYGVSAYNAANDMIFLIVHDAAYEGSHKDMSDEIWAYSLADEKLVGRSKAPHLVSLAVSQGQTPTLYGANEDDESVDVYTLEADRDFHFEKTASDDRVGWTTSLMTAPAVRDNP